jgi:hypothetical protein
MSGIVNQLGAGTGVVGTTSGAGGFESGTKQVFHQTASPTGWTKLSASGTGDDDIDNICLRCVTGTITDGVGGTVAMTTALASQAVASHVVASNEMPAHTHPVCCYGCAGYGCGVPGQGNPGVAPCAFPTFSTGGGGGHTHTSIDLAVKYVDVIVASKD